MAVLSDYTSATITLANGSTAVTGTGTLFDVAKFREGDTLQIQNLTAVIASVNSNTSLTLTAPWTGTSLTNAPFRARYMPDGARVTAQATTLIELLGNGVLSNLAELGVENGKTPVGNASGEYELKPVPTDPNGNLAKLAALALAVNKIFRTDASGNPSLGDISNAAAAMLALAGAADRMTYYTGTGAAAVTTLTAFARTLLAGASAAAMRTSLGLGTAATRDIGTSGSTVPVLNAVNTWQGRQIFQPATSVQSPGMLVQANNPWAGLPPSTGGVISSTTQGGAGTTGMSFSFLAEDKGDVNQGIIAYRGYTVSEKYWAYRSDGSAYALNGAWVNSSDRRLKENIQTIPNALEALAKLNGCTWQRIDSEAFGVGLIAQDANEAVPGSAPVVEAERELPDGTVIEDVLALDTAGVGVAVLVEAAKEMLGMIRTLEAKVSQLEGELRGLSATSN